ncbi:MAG: hypothetical protein NDI61_01930 [Bdellovibrionaceae bacterium]|nr:hypothetical protein [Pseudobdellovibrionaceae bacterium]
MTLPAFRTVQADDLTLVLRTSIPRDIQELTYRAIAQAEAAQGTPDEAAAKMVAYRLIVSSVLVSLSSSVESYRLREVEKGSGVIHGTEVDHLFQKLPLDTARTLVQLCFGMMFAPEMSVDEFPGVTELPSSDSVWN